MGICKKPAATNDRAASVMPATILCIGLQGHTQQKALFTNHLSQFYQ